MKIELHLYNVWQVVQVALSNNNNNNLLTRWTFLVVRSRGIDCQLYNLLITTINLV